MFHFCKTAVFVILEGSNILFLAKLEHKKSRPVVAEDEILVYIQLLSHCNAI